MTGLDVHAELPQRGNSAHGTVNASEMRRSGICSGRRRPARHVQALCGPHGVVAERRSLDACLPAGCCVALVSRALVRAP